jgi:hypothetical protein
LNVVYIAEGGSGDPGSEKRVVITGLFDFFDVSAKELATRATLRYGLPRKLAPILETSGRWGRIMAEIVCSMTSKYAIALYEQCSLPNSICTPMSERPFTSRMAWSMTPSALICSGYTPRLMHGIHRLSCATRQP